MDAFVVRDKGPAKEAKKVCQYGAGCYRRNPEHRRDFAHPGDGDPAPKAASPAKEAEKTKSPEAKAPKISPEAKAAAPSSQSDASSPPKKRKKFDWESDSDEGETEAATVRVPPLETEEARLRFVEEAFLWALPEDALHLYRLAAKLRPEDPRKAFSSAGLVLCGALDVVAGALAEGREVRRSALLAHARLPADPPELTTIAYDKECHYGYLRDDDASAPVFVAASNSLPLRLTVVADNALGGLESVLGKAAHKDGATKEIHSYDWQGQLLMTADVKVGAWAEAENLLRMSGTPLALGKNVFGDRDRGKQAAPDRQAAGNPAAAVAGGGGDVDTGAFVEAEGRRLGLIFAAATGRVGERRRRVVAPTLHGAGIVVAVKDDVGYRPLPDTNAELRKILKSAAEAKDTDLREGRLAKVDETITYVQFANDECDYGMGLELGIDLWTTGQRKSPSKEVFASRAEQLLSVAYLLLKRPRHAAVLKAHREHRHRDLDAAMNALFR